MKTFWALFVKFLMTFLFAWLAFGFIDGNAWGWIGFVALVGTVVNYLVGDLAVLPRFGNAVASTGDGLMAALVAYAFSIMIPEFVTSLFSLAIFAVTVAAGEYFFHGFLKSSEKVAP